MPAEKKEQPLEKNPSPKKKKETGERRFLGDNYVYGEDCLYGGSDYTHQERMFMRRDDDF